MSGYRSLLETHMNVNLNNAGDGTGLGVGGGQWACWGTERRRPF